MVSGESQIVELGFVLDENIPRVPGVPPLVVATSTAHGDYELDDGSSGCNELLVLGTHMGTHVDGWAHVSARGRIHGGQEAVSVQTRAGVSAYDMSTVPPIVAPGTLLDLASFHGQDVIDRDAPVDLALLGQLEGRDLKGAVVLLRTGWGRLWREDPRRYESLDEHRPGLDGPAAQWLADRGVIAVGTDSFSIEVYQPRAVASPLMPAHVALLVERGVFVFEALNLEDLAATGATEFLFVALPLRIAGATGSPVRPIAIA